MPNSANVTLRQAVGRAMTYEELDTNFSELIDTIDLYNDFYNLEFVPARDNFDDSGWSKLTPNVAPDIDDHTLKSGQYSTVDGETLGTFPSGVDVDGKLLVTRHDSDDVTQRYNAVADGLEGQRFFKRSYNPTTGSWESWIEDWTTFNLVPADTTKSNTFQQDVTILGNLTVSGDTVQVDSQISTADRVITLNDGESGAGVTNSFAGVEVDRGSEPFYEFGFNEATGLFELGEVGDRQPVATREFTPTNNGFAVWSDAVNRFNTISTTVVGRNFVQLGTPGSGSFVRVNDDGTIQNRTFAEVRSDLGIDTTTGYDDRYLNESNNLSDVNDAATAFNNIKQTGTTSYSGVLQLANISQSETGTDSSRATTPAGVKAAFNQYGLGDAPGFDGDIDTLYDYTGSVRLQTGASTTTGNVSISNGDYLEILEWDDNTGFQRLHKRNPLEVYERYRTGGTWDEFKEVWHTGNMPDHYNEYGLGISAWNWNGTLLASLGVTRFFSHTSGDAPTDIPSSMNDQGVGFNIAGSNSENEYNFQFWGQLTDGPPRAFIRSNDAGDLETQTWTELWTDNNLSNPMTLDTNQTVTGQKTFSGLITLTGTQRYDSEGVFGATLNGKSINMYQKEVINTSVSGINDISNRSSSVSHMVRYRLGGINNTENLGMIAFTRYDDGNVLAIDLESRQLVVGNPTGGFKGTGTLNAEGLYVSGLTVRNATLFNTGTLSDSILSNNVPLLNAANTFSKQTIIRNNSADQGALKVIQKKDDPDSPASVLIATDDDNDDIALEIRGNPSGTSVDESDRASTNTSPDMRIQMWSNGNINTVGTISALSGLSSGSLGTSLKAGRSSNQHINVHGDATGNLITGISDAANAKGILYNSTTDGANTSPSSGSNFHQFLIRGDEKFRINNDKTYSRQSFELSNNSWLWFVNGSDEIRLNNTGTQLDIYHQNLGRHANLRVNDVTVNGILKIGGNETLKQYSGGDIASAVPGSTFGTVMTGDSSGHLVSMIDGNDDNDSFSVLSKNSGTYNRRLAVLSDGNVLVGTPGGAGMGAGTLNAEGLYVDGKPTPVIETSTVALGGDFGSQLVYITKVTAGGVSTVTITSTSVLTHSFDSTPSGTNGIIPSQYRPNSSTVGNIYYFTPNSDLRRVAVSSTGNFVLQYVNTSFTQTSFEDSGAVVSITYNVPN